MTLEETLANVDIFSELPQADIARLAKVTVVRQYHDGDVIVREGELGVAFYVVSEGHVEVFKHSGGVDQVVATLGPGSFFGEMALFDNHVRSASVRAKGPCECLVLTKWDFNAELSASGCRIATAMLAILARRIRTLTDAATH
ncbi:MAG TPA: cyclic nucleotide-binding domain-containing protein [Dehalococcoidia bacterium]|nr:cyclic nucleotide-binding domain-containing protein [Dehalococcoidia bacterium]